MREYELMVIYDLTFAETQGADAAANHLTSLVETYGGTITVLDHWGRRRMAYRINNQLDGDYVVARADLDGSAVRAIEGDLRIAEQVFRWQVVRTEELPPLVPGSMPPTRQARGEGAPPGRAPAATATATATAEAPAEPAAEPAEAPAVAEPAEETPQPGATVTPDAPGAATDEMPEAPAATAEEAPAEEHAAEEPAPEPPAEPDDAAAEPEVETEAPPAEGDDEQRE